VILNNAKNLCGFPLQLLSVFHLKAGQLLSRVQEWLGSEFGPNAAIKISETA